ncbi:hypothetical protein DFP73DRAFT_567236 [Morchella snyderi]|nr:hypothetical protein DFP73DRAFT_567236 [Morchella snyderi]
MTLGSETAAVLRQGLDALLHIMGPAPHERLSTAELMSALTHLTVTANAAAKLADAAHAEMLALPTESGGDVQCIRAEAERLRAEAEKVEKETKWAWQETERLKAQVENVRTETEKVGKETENVLKKIESSLVETVGPKMDMNRVGTNVYRSMTEKERVEAEAEVEKVGRDLKRSAEETKGLQVELDRVRKERSTNDSDIRKLRSWLDINSGWKRDRKSDVEDDKEKIEKRLETLVADTKRFKVMEDWVGSSIENSEQETKRLQGVLDLLRSGAVLQNDVEG